MQLTDIRIKLCEADGSQRNRLKGFCALTFDGTFVIRDVKLIDGNDGLFLAMPSRKLSDHCGRCGEKNHLRARYCNNCGARLDENRSARVHSSTGPGRSSGGRLKLYADIAHPVNAACRQAIEQQVVNAYHDEMEKSRKPGYVPPNLDGEDLDFFEHSQEQVESPSNPGEDRHDPPGRTLASLQPGALGTVAIH